MRKRKPPKESSKFNFTRRSIDNLALPNKEYALHRDTAVKGLGCKVEPSGTKSYFWSRKAGGRAFWMTIGDVSEITLEDARAKASEYNMGLAKFKLDGCIGEPSFVRPKGLTLGQIIESYKDRHIRAKAKRPERMAAEIDGMTERHLSSLKERPLSRIVRSDIVKVHETVGEKSKFSANRLVQMIRAAVYWAIKVGQYVGENPARNVELFAEKERDRYLKPHELAQLWQALSRSENKDLVDFVNLGLWCGARKMDILSARWSDVSLDGDNRWLFPDPKSGEPYTVPLTDEALEILRERRARAEAEEKRTGIARSIFVFPSHGKSGHLADMKKAWRRILKEANLDYPDTPEMRPRIHDLRRTHGSAQAAQGSSLVVIGKSLGHTSTDATKIYARLDLSAVHEAMSAANKAMAAMMKAKAKPRLTPAPARKRLPAKKAARA